MRGEGKSISKALGRVPGTPGLVQVANYHYCHATHQHLNLYDQMIISLKVFLKFSYFIKAMSSSSSVLLPSNEIPPKWNFSRTSKTVLLFHNSQSYKLQMSCLVCTFEKMNWY